MDYLNNIMLCQTILFLSSVWLVLKKKKVVRNGIRRWHVRPINLRRSDHGMFQTTYQVMRRYDPEEFFKYTRMSVDLFDDLVTLIRDDPLMKRSGRVREPVSVEERLAITLGYLAHGGSMKSVALHYLRGVSTVSFIVRNTCRALWRNLKDTYLSPPTRAEWEEIRRDFFLKWNVPCCLGAIDGKHVIMQKPAKSGSRNRNYKDSFSLILMAVVDANFKFRLVDIGGLGSESDGGIFRKSMFGKAWINNDLDAPLSSIVPNTQITLPNFLLGDAAFPLMSNLMRPYSKPRGRDFTDSERIFNYRLSRGRRVVENAFGIMASRFRIFRKPIIAEESTVDVIVMACVCLHNFLLHHMPSKSSTLADHEDELGNTIPGEYRDVGLLTNLNNVRNVATCNLAPRAAYDIRDVLKRYFLTSEGEYPPQYKVLTDGYQNPPSIFQTY